MDGVRQWRISDLRAIQQVAWDTWTDTYSQYIPEADRQSFHDSYYTMDKLRNLFTSKIVQGCVAELSDQIVGYSKTYWNEKGNEFFITSLYVLREFQKQQFGKQMLAYGLNSARKHNIDRVWLGVMIENRPAIDWYVRQGFIFEQSKPFAVGKTTIDHLYGYKLI